MGKEKEFVIQFSGLKIGTHDYEYQINKEFFNLFEYEEYNSVDVNVKAIFIKKETLMELYLEHKGVVNVPCDVTGVDFDLPIKGELKLVIKFGEEYNDDNEELLILPHGEYQLNIAQYIYESIVLSVPQKRVHPDIAEEYEVDKYDEDELDFLLEIDEENEEREEEQTEENNNKQIDPRWDKLKKLLTDK